MGTTQGLQDVGCAPRTKPKPGIGTVRNAHPTELIFAGTIRRKAPAPTMEPGMINHKE
jgi:hypothetical protein